MNNVVVSSLVWFDLVCLLYVLTKRRAAYSPETQRDGDQEEKKKKKKHSCQPRHRKKGRQPSGQNPFDYVSPIPGKQRKRTRISPFSLGIMATMKQPHQTQHWHRPSRGCSVPPPPSTPGAVGIKRLNPIHQCHSATAAEEAKPSPPHLIAHFALHEYKQRQHPSSIPIRLYKDCGRSPVHNPHPALREHQ